MTKEEKEEQYGDPTTIEFWEAAKRKELVLQHCKDCDHYQFYPRPFCLDCESTNLEWKQVSGDGTVYSMTEVHVKISPDFEPPYVVALVELDEGPRMVGNIVDGEAGIGDRVKLMWRNREDAPPLPVWTPA
jgi:uncharacterized OB-fold protein